MSDREVPGDRPAVQEPFRARVEIPVSLTAPAAGDAEPVFITLGDGETSQVLAAYPDFALARRKETLALDAADSAWADCLPIHVGGSEGALPKVPPAWQGPGDVSATVRTAWNDQGLFFLVRVKECIEDPERMLLEV